MKKSIIYRVFDWGGLLPEATFDTLKKAEKYYLKMKKEEPFLSWRLYRDTEKPARSGNFTEDCLLSSDDDDDDKED